MKTKIWERVHPPQKRTVVLQAFDAPTHTFRLFFKFPSLRFRIGYKKWNKFFVFDYLQVFQAGKLFKKIGKYTIINFSQNGRLKTICLGRDFKGCLWETLDSLADDVISYFWQSNFHYFKRS